MALHGYLTGIQTGQDHGIALGSQLSPPQETVSLPPSCSSPNQGVIRDPPGPCVGSTASQGWGLPSGHFLPPPGPVLAAPALGEVPVISRLVNSMASQ